MGKRISTGGSSGSTAGAAAGAIGAGSSVAFMSGSNPATCKDDTFGCKLSHATNNLMMLARILVLGIAIIAFLYYLWIFVRNMKKSRK